MVQIGNEKPKTWKYNKLIILFIQGKKYTHVIQTKSFNIFLILLAE